MLLRCVLRTYKILHYTGTSGGDTDEVDFAEQPSAEQPSTEQPSAGQPSTGQPSTGQPSIRQPSTAQPFKCKIVVDHMLVCEEVLPDGE